MTVRSRIGLAVGITVLAGVLTACTSTVSGTPTRASQGTGAGRVPATEAHLAALVIQPTDLPLGWSSTPHQADPSSPDSTTAIAACMGVSVAHVSSPVADANSPDYKMGTEMISSDATSYRSQRDIEADLAVLRNPKATACLKRDMGSMVATQLPPGMKILGNDVKLTGPATGEPQNVVSQMDANVTVSYVGRTITVYVTIAFIEGPLIEATVGFTTVGAPYPAGDASRLVGLVAQRVANG